MNEPRRRGRRDADLRAVPADARARRGAARLGRRRARRTSTSPARSARTPLGHGHPAWVAAVREQLDTLDIVSNLFATRPQADARRRLAELAAGARRARLLLQLRRRGERGRDQARAQARPRRRAKPAIVALEGSFHGRTIATLAATGQPAQARRRSSRSSTGSGSCRPATLDALDAAIDRRRRRRAARAGAGGGRRAAARRRRTCARRASSATSAARCWSPTRCSRASAGAATGSALQHAGVVPDVRRRSRRRSAAGCRSARCVARAELAFEPGEHASTFGGGPIVVRGRARGARRRSSTTGCSSARGRSGEPLPRRGHRGCAGRLGRSRSADAAASAASSSRARSRTRSCWR